MWTVLYKPIPLAGKGFYCAINLDNNINIG